jgi:hypothetical protein
MDMRYESEELDSESLEYLRDVHHREGRGYPGVYLGSKQANLYTPSMPWWSLGCAPVVLIVTLLLTWGSFRNPTKVAFLMTAGFFLGFWMLIAWLRCLIGRQRNDYLGHFKYIDPLYVWYATGRGVWVTPISMLLRADVNHTHTGEGNYKSSTVTIHLADGRTDVEVNGSGRAEQLEAFLNELPEVRRGTPAERGYEAIDRLREREYEDDDDRRRKRRVEAIPEPHRARTSPGWLRYVVLLACVIPLFFICRSIASFSRDGAMYEELKNGKHPEARAYLADPRNTRYRKEMLERLAGFHDDAAKKLDPATFLVPEARTGLKEVILGLKEDPHPWVTVRFFSSGKGDADPGTHLSEAVRGTMHRDMIKTLSDRIGRKVGADDFLNFGEATEPPATIEVDAVLTLPAADVPAAGQARIDWTVTFQVNADSPKTVAKLFAEAPMGKDKAAVVRQLFRQFTDKLLPE